MMVLISYSEKVIHDEEASNADIARSNAELKVKSCYRHDIEAGFTKSVRRINWKLNMPRSEKLITVRLLI
jgi:hypothetical protein